MRIREAERYGGALWGAKGFRWAESGDGGNVKKLPEHVFVSLRDNGDDEWLTCEVDAQGAIEDDGPTLVGTYKLVEVNKLSKRVESEKAKNKLR